MLKTIPNIIETFKHRDKTAFIYKTGYRTFSVSYKDLYKKIQQTIIFLEKQDLKKDDKIILWGYNTPDWIAVFLATASKSIILVPLDYMATGDFVEKIAAIVKAKAIFHSEFKMLPKRPLKTFVLEYLDKYLEGPTFTHRNNKINEHDLLEIVFTSGTTGDPKGVMLTHKNLIANILSIKKTIHVSSDQTFLSLLPLSHLFEQNPGFLAPLSEGCTIVYIRGLKPSLIFKTLREERITNIIIVPRLLQLFADGIKREIAEKKQAKLFNTLLKLKVSKTLKKLFFYPVHKKFGMQFQYFVSGGAPLSEELQTFWEHMGFTILQGYGLTECSPVLTANRLDKQVIGSAGLTLPDVQIKIADDGEIYAKGKNITQGYYHKEKQSKELFDHGWMKTGDIGYQDNQGYLYIKGRKKDVIVTGAGIKVYPEDIEQILLQNKAVKDACVVGLPTPNGEEVHAEILLKQNEDLKTIIDKANRQLNQTQQIVSYGLWQEEDFPRTTTMKIKKNIVLEQLLNRSNQNPLNYSGNISKLHRIIAQVCHINPTIIEPDAKLALDLKLSSINRVELASILEQEFNADIDEEEITQHTTVAQLEKLVKERKKLSEKDIFRRWTLSYVTTTIRIIWNFLIADNMIRIFCRRTVIGKEHLKNLKTPVIFIANHVGYFDTPNILLSLPFHTRYNIATAAWKEYFEVPKNQIFKRLLFSFYYQYASIFVNIYLFPKQKGFKKSLEYTGELLDKGWNILFFPEGEHSPSGNLQSFRPGIGLLVKEMHVPIVPIKHVGLEKIMSGDTHQVPRFGKVTVKFGQPILVDYTKSIPEIANELHEILQKM